MTETAVGTPKPPHPIIVLREYLNERVDTFKNALPSHIKPERFIASVLTAVQLNPDLLAADRRSLFVACMRAAQDGLMPDGTEAAIVPYKKNAQYLPMYQGLLKKFRNSGQFKWITSNIVYEGEDFDHWIDQDGEHFRHVPSNDNPNRKIKRVYAVATTIDGGFFIADLSPADIEKRRNMSRASRDDAPWKQWEQEMMKKTAIRVLSKLLPKSSDIDQFMQRDEQESLGIDIADQHERSAGNALDHFAGETSTDSLPADVGGGSPQGPDVALPSSQPSTAPGSAAVSEAYARGQEWRAQGNARNAMPPEYRAADRRLEANAWQDGFDGKPKPGENLI